MERFELALTLDGTFTIKDLKIGETFHSINGACSESLYVYIKQGFLLLKETPSVSIFEMGYGSGLNAFLTLLHKPKSQIVYYEAVDKFPLPSIFFDNITKVFPQNEKEIYNKILNCPWNNKTVLAKNFTLLKKHCDIETYLFEQKFDLIYFDAFSAKNQPELWSKEIFNKLYSALNPGGILLTYACNSKAKEQLTSAGFEIERIKGALNKKHMLRAKKST